MGEIIAAYVVSMAQSLAIIAKLMVLLVVFSAARLIVSLAKR